MSIAVFLPVANVTAMARYSDPIPTNAEALRKFADNLRKMADDFESQAERMKELGLESIEVTHWKSARDGVSGYAAFAAAVKKAIVFDSQMSAVNGLLIDPTQQAVSAAVDSDAPSSRKKQQRHHGNKTDTKL